MIYMKQLRGNTMKPINNFNEECLLKQLHRYDVNVYGHISSNLLFIDERYANGKLHYVFEDHNGLEVFINPSYGAIYHEQLMTEEEHMANEKAEVTLEDFDG